MRIESLSPMMARSLMAALPRIAPGFPIGEEEPARSMPTHAAHAAQTTPSVAMLVTLAAGDPGIERRRRMAKDAERGIDGLDRLHRELVAGTAGPARLREIADWSASFEVPEDPALAAILAEIDLRVRVELAKFDIEA